MNIIYILEDDDNIRELVAYALAGAGFETRVFLNGEGFLSALKEAGSLPAMAILDIMLPAPGGDGLEILRGLRRAYGELPVIIMTAKGSEHERIRGLELGADDYVTKPFSVLELVSRVKAVLRRSRASKAASLEAGALEACGVELAPQSRSVRVGGLPVHLTFKEFELLHYLMLNKGLVLSRSQLLENVWGFDFEGETRTVDMHIRMLRQKLGESAACIETIRNVGYRII